MSKRSKVVVVICWIKERKERELKAIRSPRVLQTQRVHRSDLTRLVGSPIPIQDVGSKSQGLSFGVSLSASVSNSFSS